MAFAAGIPQVQLTVAQDNASTTDFVVSGAMPHSAIEILKLTRVDGHLTATAVKESVATGSPGHNLTLGVESGNVRPGVYVAVELTASHTLRVSVPFAWKVSTPSYAAKLVTVPSLTSGSATLNGGHIRADVPSTLNGPTCGSVSLTKSATGWIATWTGCNTILDNASLYNGDPVLVMGAPPYDGKNPFDNPPFIAGIWQGNVNVDAHTSTIATVNIGFDNNQGSYSGKPFVPGEWFMMELVSSTLETPAGQLPEVPWAAALPVALAVPGLIVMMKKRRGQVT
jgi:hypothetical protein